MAKLTQKQKAFADELLNGKTPEEAFRAADYRKGDPERRARKLMENPKIRKYWREQREKRRPEDRQEWTRRILAELSKIAFDDIGNYLEFYTEEIDGKRELLVQVKDSRKLDTRSISEVTVTKDGKATFKLYSKERALFKLADLLKVGADTGGGKEDNGLLEALKRAAEAVKAKEDGR